MLSLHLHNFFLFFLKIAFLLQTSQWRSSCGAYRRSVPARCVWIKRSTSSSSPVDTWWCVKSVRHHCESARSAEAWLKAQFEPFSHKQEVRCQFYHVNLIYRLQFIFIGKGGKVIAHLFFFFFFFFPTCMTHKFVDLST